MSAGEDGGRDGTARRPDTAASLNARGMDLTAAERYEEAIAAFDRALELEPRNAGLRFNRGEACRRAGKSAEAKAELGRRASTATQAA